MTTNIAQKHLDKSIQHNRDAMDSFERSDTDGFLTQWASGMMSRLEYAKYEIAENDGKWEFPALFDLDGNLVPAKHIKTPYGMAWGILESDDVDAPFIGFFNPSQAQNEARARANNAKKGYYVGRVKADAYADLYAPAGARGMGGAMDTQVIVLRADKGWSEDVEVIDNGKDK